MASNAAMPQSQPRPATGTGTTRETPQAVLTTYGPRMQAYNNALLVPILAPSSTASGREHATKRGITIINYAEGDQNEDDDDDDEDEEAGGRRRLTGLRRMRRENTFAPKPDPADRVSKNDAHKPVGIPAVWRDWMSSQELGRTDLQNAAQSQLPCSLVPIRLDVDIPPFMTQTALPLHPSLIPQDADPSLFRPGEMTVPYKIRDFFMWNLYESLITTDQFAQTLLQDLDLPIHASLIHEISKQIRTQLEENAGITLHPLFHPTRLIDNDTNDEEEEDEGKDDARLTAPAGRNEKNKIPRRQRDLDAILNPDDAYRCIIKLDITLGARLYTDKFEWSLLHPPGHAEEFAKVTCADLGLKGEWIPALTHGIYEAVLQLKKEFIENNGLVSGWSGVPNEFPNDSQYGTEAGVCYDPEGLCEAREPRIELLGKEEMEKREIDRERQLRRLRRETTRTSSMSMLGVGGGSFSLVAEPIAPSGQVPVAAEEERMGQGERPKKNRRIGSLHPLRYEKPGTLTDQERLDWRCNHCMIRGAVVWGVQNGPEGPKSLCMSCGYILARDGRLSSVTKDLHLNDPQII